MAKKKSQERNNADPFRWRTFLKKVSRDMLKDIRIREDLPDDVIASGWLGYAGASEEEIVALEMRLGKTLPPSFRSFLAETNGWRECGPFIYKLWPCSEIRWFRERNQEWIDAYMHPENAGIEIVWPLPEQVAPIILLIDETLRPLMTRERCEFILSTPRGRLAVKT